MLLWPHENHFATFIKYSWSNIDCLMLYSLKKISLYISYLSHNFSYYYFFCIYPALCHLLGRAPDAPLQLYLAPYLSCVWCDVLIIIWTFVVDILQPWRGGSDFHCTLLEPIGEDPRVSNYTRTRQCVYPHIDKYGEHT